MLQPGGHGAAHGTSRHRRGSSRAEGLHHCHRRCGAADLRKGLAALTPAIIEASYTGNESKFADIAKLFGGKEAKDLALKIRELLKSINLNCTLSDLGIEEKDSPWMAENCMKVSAASVANNPVVFTQEQIEDIYKKAL